MRNKKGFTMVELLVVLVIVAILAAVATPIYLANVKRSRASEAVSAMALIRQALRDYQINADTYFDIDGTTHLVNLPLPSVSDITTATGAVAEASPSGVNVNAGVTQYFSNSAFSVDAVNQVAVGNSGEYIAPNPNTVDFLITANGNLSNPCAAAGDTDCATRQSEVDTYRLEMDNSGRTYVCYDWTVAYPGGTCTSGWALY